MSKNNESRRLKYYFLVLLVFFSILPSKIFAAEGWTRKAEMPTARYGLTINAVNGKIYAIGGRAGGQFFSTVEVYDPVADTWTNATNMPTNRTRFSSSIVGGRIYAIGGDVGTGPIKTVEEYDPATDTWTRKTDMPTGRRALSTSVVNGKIYAIGGYHRGGTGLGESLVAEYDPATNTWKDKADMPTGRADLSTSAVNGKIYAIGGSVWPNPVLSTLEEYDPTTDTWTRKADMPTARSGLSTTAVNGKIYAVGGQGNNMMILSTVEIYDPSTDTWAEMPEIQVPRFNLSTCTLNRKIYAIGGNSGPWPTVTGAVEVYYAGPWGFATDPSPGNGATYFKTWATLNWTVGDFAVSHKVYLSENFEDVNARTGDAFRGNQTETFYVAGFPGFAYPDGLVPGTTYYWRVDEVNDSHPDSPWKGPVWSFSIPPRKAYGPVPADGAESVDLNVELGWSSGLDATLHTIYFGESFEDANNATGGTQRANMAYSPGPLKPAKTYFWRVDELADVRGSQTIKGDIWSFRTVGGAEGPSPSNGAVNVKPTKILTWNTGYLAASHDVYFGTEAEAVKNATKASPEYKGQKAIGEENYDPGMLLLETDYYWRIDEVNSIHPDSPWKGAIWKFTTGNFFVVDDFEDYDAGENRIWYAWHDGFGYGIVGSANYFAGNGTGSMVGDENTVSYTEETIVHSGKQSMPVSYDNNQQGKLKYSEVEMILSSLRDWTQQGVIELSLWFRGYPASVGSFVESPAGIFTMTGLGSDTNTSPDELHFAYKVLTGPGSIVARIDSIENTHRLAKAGVMIRETLTPDSVQAFMCLTATQGVNFQGRIDRDIEDFVKKQGGITTPHWVKLERDIGGKFTAYHSTDGSNWQIVENALPHNIKMNTNVYIGLAVTSHNDALTCQATFSNVQIDGVVSSTWMNQDIGIASNSAEPLYVAIANNVGEPAVVYHNDPAATNIDTWTEWNINLSKFADQGVDLTNIERVAIGIGTRGNVTNLGGSGKVYFDDIRLRK